jgi:long-subunit fatty acid transport protein
LRILSSIVKPIGWAVLAAFLLLTPTVTWAVFNEQIAVDAKAIALANTCTADPPGLMSVHYNPAGLSLLDDGHVFSNGFGLPIIKRTGRFKTADDFDGFMSGFWGPDPSKYPDYYEGPVLDPNSDHGGPDPLDGKSGTNSSGRMYLPFYGPIDFLAAPTLGLSSRKPNSKWTFAYANYAPYGGGMAHRDSGDPFQFGCKSLYAQHLIYAAPSVSLAVSDTLSLGLSIGMAQRSMGLELDVRTPNELVALTRVIGDATRDLEIPVVSETTLPPPWLGGGLGPYEHALSLSMNLRDDFVPSVNMGLLWRPRSWFSYGFCYQSESVGEISGKYIWEYSEQFQSQVHWNSKTPMTMEGAGMLDLPINKVPYQSGTATATQIFPARIQTGIMLRPLDRIKFLFDVHWANWARAGKEDRFVFDQRIQLLRIAKMLGYQHDPYTFVVNRNMQDTWHWSTGMEFMVTDTLSLRCGYEKRPTSLQHDQFDALYFIPDADFVGAGFGLKLPNGIDFDFGLGYLWSNHFTIYNNESTNFNSTDFTQIGNPFAGLDYEQDLSIYIVSFGVTMPLEVQLEMMHHQQEMIKHTIHKIKGLIHKLNPFKKETRHDEAGDTQAHTREDNEEDDFNRYLDRLSADYYLTN